MAEKPITTAPYSTGVSGDYYIFVNDNGVLRQVDIDIISKHLGNVTWTTLTGKPFNNVDSDEFTISGETLKINGYHTHNNVEILNNFALDENGTLMYDGNIIGGYVLPVATEETLGGIKPDGTTITIDADGTIHGANTYELPTASDTVLSGVKIDNDTIKSNNGVISADVIGNWSAGTSYPVGYFVVYGEGMWECMVAHTSQSAFEESKWMPTAFRAVKVYNWSANTAFSSAPQINVPEILPRHSDGTGASGAAGSFHNHFAASGFSGHWKGRSAPEQPTLHPDTSFAPAPALPAADLPPFPGIAAPHTVAYPVPAFSPVLKTALCLPSGSL